MAIAKKLKASMSHSSMIRKMFEEGALMKKKYGADNVYDFSLGNPNVEPPQEFKKELRNLAAKHIPLKHGYAPNAGFAETRQAISEKINKTYGLKLTADHIVMSCGAAGALNVIFKSLLDPKDEVIVLKPFFVEYPFYVENFGGVVKFVNTKEDFSLDVDAIGKAINKKTKAIIINSPNNPTGRVYSPKNIKDLAVLLKKKGRELNKTIYLVSDEPYNEIVYDHIKVPGVLKAYANSIVAYSYSKTLSLPGERIGYIAVNPKLDDAKELISALILCTRILGFVHAPALMQRIVLKLQDAAVDVKVYQKKRDLLCAGLSKAGYTFAKPQGAFYLFVKSPLPDDVEFIKILLKKNILAVPGSGFGCPGYFRIAYCVDDQTIINAIPGFSEAIRECS
ncbi:MAG TPA: pyridoxal phosphate-dependent aminotransferase [Smithella sp.]|nr:pyridoxal phosphate-dependent aminotransferase [Smithella sp.]MDM7986098.1 pyridoxal phosphate-dependent aminotransferase [Smithella sp.]HNY49005.1 pyridoxal phosphate-dependent aminotransferase [Smithella sp.]HOG89089.1 pyridoxal phosphate-dependent aminotransferase [Smithella sp.]HOU51001.1 pyridoxal phosphate-dependent aminotransferase [Smithella sp.]